MYLGIAPNIDHCALVSLREGLLGLGIALPAMRENFLHSFEECGSTVIQCIPAKESVTILCRRRNTCTSCQGLSEPIIATVDTRAVSGTAFHTG